MTGKAHSQRVFLAGLLMEGRHALVVGGGKVALHKVHLLRDSGAEITVVAPNLSDEIRQMAEAKALHHLNREFQEDDVSKVYMVFAATNDKVVNRKIIESCRKRGVLCCSADGNWVAGDFITPAVFRKDELTVSVSTGGRSCRRSRMVKENLARHIEMVETADLIVMGTSHEYLPIDRREPFHLLGKRLERMGQMLMHVWGIHEFMLLNTCNRVELIGVVSKGTELNTMLARILGFDHLSQSEYYIEQGLDAFEHVAVLSAGLYSQVPGENHIVAQVKEALDLAIQQGWARGMMQEWVAAALHVSKDIRTVSGSLLRNFEIEDLCMQYLRAERPVTGGQRVLVLGAGVVGTEMVKRILAILPSADWCYHINKPAIPDTWKDRVTLHTFDDLKERLPGVDLVICATDSPHHVLLEEHGSFFSQDRDVLILDLSMPRNVAPSLDGLTPRLKVVDLEDLKHWYRREAADMEKIFAISSQTVNEHKSLYEKILRTFQGNNEAE